MINLLSQETINKIAAGEVVERPLNAVKELVENSLDACASSVNVEISQAGKKLIRVADDGFGMDKADLELSVVRHATSKINAFEDLQHIQSMGFRGEALASIAAVSNFEIKTRKRGESSGWKLSTEGGANVRTAPWSGAQGTITQADDLFFNVPARRKFLKSDSTERSKIISCLEETAMANPEVSFKLVSDGKTVFSSAKTDRKTARIADILGSDFASKLRNAKASHGNTSIDIYFTGRDDARSDKKYQYFFVNSRPVNFPKWLIHCVYNAYKESIPREKHPGVLIYISIDPSDIDINIHPAKREIKFADENGLYDLLYKTLRMQLVSHAHPSLGIAGADDKPSPSSFTYAAREESPQEIYLKEPKVHLAKHYTPVEYAVVFKPLQNAENEKTDNALSKTDKSAQKPELPAAPAEQKLYSYGDMAFEDDNIKVLGQFSDTYVIAQKDGVLYIFDQHAAAERVRYEAYISQAGAHAVKLQQMLIPENFQLSSSLSELLKSNIEILNELGIYVEEFGDKSFRITAYPALLGDISVENIIKQILEDSEIEKNCEIEKKRDKIIRSACRASIKAGDSVSSAEAKKLITDLFKCDYPFTCPHGRPTAYKVSKDELEKFFKRK
jgi:DNA mismatch repair protein MutL